MFKPTTSPNMEKAYVGTGRQKQGSEYITLSICFEDLMNAYNLNSFAHSNGKLYVNVMLARNRKDQFGRTHALYIQARKTDAERSQEQMDSIADQQEIEVRKHDEENA